MTRAAPARLLGLHDRGHLGVGAAADIAVYRERCADPRGDVRDARAGVQGRRASSRATAASPPRRPAACTSSCRSYDRSAAQRCAEHSRAPWLRESALRRRSRATSCAAAATAARLLPRERATPRRRRHDRAQRRRHRRHLRRSLPDEGDAAGRHRAQPRNGRCTRRSPPPASPPRSSPAAARPASRPSCPPSETPDGRPGVALLLFAMSGKELAKQIERRVGQCVLTCPTTAVFAGLDEGEPIALAQEPALLRRRLADQQGDRRPALLARAGDGRRVRRRGDHAGGQGASAAATCCCWRATPTPRSPAREAAVAAMRELPSVIMPFPGGVVRSGSKVGSKYPALSASTNHAFCPSLADAGRRQRADAGHRAA